MTSRERFLATVNHQPVDRPPSDFICEEWMRIPIVEYLGAKDFEDAQRRLKTDLRLLSHNSFRPPYVRDETGAFTDMWGTIRKPVVNQFGAYDEVVYRPFAEMTDLKQVEEYPWPTPDIYDFSTLKARAQEHHDNYAVVFGEPGIMDLINGIAFARGMEQLMIDIGLDDPVGMALIEKRHEIIYAVAENGLKAADGLIDVLWIGDDYGSQNGPTFSMETWNRVFRPKLQAYIDLGHKYGAKVMLHSCGSNRGLIPTWIEMGLDIYQSVQVEAAGMEPTALLKDFGKDITFHGMIGLQSTLPHGTPEDVRRDVLARWEAAGGTGYIAAPAHFWEPDVPMENVVALYEAAASIGSA